MTDTRDRVEAALDQAFRDGGDMVTKWTLCAEVIDQEGVRSVWLLAPQHMTAWDSLGLIEYARQVEQASTLRNEGDA